MSFRDAEEIINDDEKGAAELTLDTIDSILEFEEEGEVVDYLTELIQGRRSMAPLFNLQIIYLSCWRMTQILGRELKILKKT